MTITNRIVEAYLSCKYKAYLLLKGETGSPHDYEVLMDELADEYRPKATKALLRRLKLESAPTISSVTVDDLKQSHPLILNCTVETDQFRFHFDALTQADGKSSLGSFNYQPVKFHHEEKVRENAKTVLAGGAVVLATMQARASDHGSLVIGEMCRVSKVQLGKRSQKLGGIIDELGHIIAEPIAPQLRLNRHCDVCEFRERCQLEATEKDDLSLLRGMSDAEIEKHNGKGIFTVNQLSYTFRPRRKSKRVSEPRPKQSHALQARSIRESTIYVAHRPSLPVSDSLLYLDIEAVPDRNLHYLIGTLIVDSNDLRFHSFWANGGDKEGVIWRTWLDLLDGIPNFAIFHYGVFELDWVRRMKQIYGGNLALIERIEESMCDLLSAIRCNVYFPVLSHRLKDVAPALGFRWSGKSPSGMDSIVWRCRWERSRRSHWKTRLINYNREDCYALKLVTDTMRCICEGGDTSSEIEGTVPSVANAGDITDHLPYVWGPRPSCCSEFSFIKKRAYFDYQRDKIWLRRHRRSFQARKPTRRKSGSPRVTKVVVHPTPERCPICSTQTIEHRRTHTRTIIDLKRSSRGVRAQVTKHTARRYRCPACDTICLPEEYVKISQDKGRRRFGDSLGMWCVYRKVALKQSTYSIVQELSDVFGLNCHQGLVTTAMTIAAARYETIRSQILERLRAGPIIHMDETWAAVNGKPGGRGYVWVMATPDSVVYAYSDRRQGSVAKELLEQFKGVLVSDFFSGYDGIDCPQQKCLSHLVRDFNDDVLKRPFDDERRHLAQAFGALLRPIVETIDRFGLKRHNLRKHRREVDRFYQRACGNPLRSKTAERFRKRMNRFREKLFTFLDYDGVPWNNANAEHAVKAFVTRRKAVISPFSESGIKDFLVLLSIYETLRYRGQNFFDFLLSRKTSLNW